MKYQVLAIFTLLGFTTIFAQYSPCQIGTCINIQQCPKLYELLTTYPLSEENTIFLRSRLCGSEDKLPKVCCTYREKNDDRNLGVDNNDDNIIFDEPQKKIEQYEAARRLLPTECGEGILIKRIIGGQATGLDEFPWMAILEYYNGSNKVLKCGGSLINERYVLTAAHCIRRPVYEGLILVSVRLGEYNTQTERNCIFVNGDKEVCSDNSISIRIERKIVHENFNDQQQNDIALLRLERGVTFTKYIKPICLPTGPELNSNFMVAGWGMTEFGSDSNVKLKVRLPLRNRSECDANLRALKLTFKTIDSQICVGGQSGKDSCNGDSGGPLMQENIKPDDYVARWEVAGIVSYAFDEICGLPDKPAVYTYVYKYVPWILSKIKP